MLQSLHISNYALIDYVEIDFRKGLNIITGETGAGKSVMLGALSLLLGARADRHTAAARGKKSVIEATFQIDGYPMVNRFCRENDIDTDDSLCILRREISATGRSRAFINDTPVPLSRLEGLAIHLVDIHSQHRNQLLSQPAFQLEIIDTLADNATLLTEYRRRYHAFREALATLRRARTDIERTRTDEEFTRFQLAQINAAAPMAGELEELERDRDLIADAANLKTTLTRLNDILGNHTDALLAEAADLCGDLDTLFAGDEQELTDRIEAARIELRDIAQAIAAADRTLDADPARLDATDRRITELHTIMRRFHADSVEQLIDMRNEMQRRLDDLDNAPDRLADLEKAARRAGALARETAREISARRSATAARFADDLRNAAMPLGMKNLCVEINVAPADLGPDGIDHVEFLFAFNKNQQPTSVAQTASGGEVSRLMLAIKCIVADKIQLPSLIFDEVDSGVSGDVAARMGQMMLAMAREMQVIAITHLPQVAARGETHFKVYKEDDDSATHTRITPLDRDGRIAELALMLSGNAGDPDARRTAETLLNNRL